MCRQPSSNNTNVQITNVSDISGHNLSGILLKTDGSVWGWGYSYYGEPGTGLSGYAQPNNPTAQSVAKATSVLGGRWNWIPDRGVTNRRRIQLPRSS